MPQKADNATNAIFEVQSAEAGQKLLQYLIRKIALPQSLIHRWIRTGQIRVNGGRAKPFMLVQEGDGIRLPPFAPSMIASALAQKTPVRPTQKPSNASPNFSTKQHLPKPQIVFESEHILVLNKEAGLPVHTGTNHTDSLATRLEVHFPNEIFKPTPAHRLDKDTSGLLLVARSYQALRALQDAFQERYMIKEYLTWVQGLWPQSPKAELLRHHIQKSYVGDDEKVRILCEAKGKEAISFVRCLKHSHHCSLMHIRLITGRKHQIRVQMAEQGHPVMGDGKYGQGATQLCLHAMRITLPDNDTFTQLGLTAASFSVLPPWSGWQKVEKAPSSLTDIPNLPYTDTPFSQDR